MDKIASLFTTIGDILNASSWFPLVKGPFWTLLAVLAFSGVYTARFEKKRLVTLSIQCVLKLALLYMIAAACYIWFPSLVSEFSQLPFFSVSEESLTLVNPLGLLDRWNTALPRVVVRLFFLMFFINLIGILEHKAANVLTWIFFQGIVGVFGLLLYVGFHLIVVRFWPGSIDTFYKVFAVLVILLFGILLAFKLYYAFGNKNGNDTFQKIYEFFTEKPMGMQLTVSAIAFLIAVGYLAFLAFTGHNRLALDAVNPIAFAINCIMTTMTLYVFSRYYNG